MTSHYLELSKRITWAFVLLGLVIALAGGVCLHYLEGVRVYQLQYEGEWQEYRRMVLAEDVLKGVAMDISAWQAGMLPVEQLKAKAGEMTRALSSWAKDEQEEKKRPELVVYEKEEALLLLPARQAFGELTTAIAALQPVPTATAATSLIRAIDQLQTASRRLQQFYFGNISRSLADALKARHKAQNGSVYFILTVIFLVLAISGYSVRVLRRQAKQLMEQERQMALVALVQHLAHEIRNPLGIVKSAASVIARRSTGDVVMLADDITSEVERVDGLLTDLLHIHRGEQHKPKVPTDMSALVRRVADLFASKLAAAGLMLEIDDQAPGSLVTCHSDAVKQVVMNVLLNAIEASMAKETIRITLTSSPGEYIIQIRDYGVGLKAEQKQKIWDLMYTTKPYGFGIGLTVVKRIVEDHGGRIGVSNPPPRGTAFTIYFPTRD
ncbi:MAG: HAMP domain-containing histidine kinase [Candidatus Omnitrophica bacterium]|nr:HAMP domain-containing histidine kinase [Candidatus Omnitrophota bacterium]